MSEYTASLPAGTEDGQICLILVGLVGSGKSTFAHALEDNFPNWRRCNQDDLGARWRVENLARQSLAQGLSVCIDRTNFDASQRAHWIRIAREFPGVSIWVIVFDCPVNVCADRLRERKSHPTIRSFEEGMFVLDRFASNFVPPAENEGYDRLIRLSPSDQSLVYSVPAITAIIGRIRQSSPVTSHATPNPSSRGSHSFLGDSFRVHSFRDSDSRGYIDSSDGRVPGGRSLGDPGSMNASSDT